MGTDEKIHIVGIGDDGLDGLTVAARRLIENADLLVGARSTLSVLPTLPAERLEVGTDLDQVVRRLEEAKQRRIVVLAVGDPLFYGMARYLCDRLGKDRFDVVPHVSSMQLAFARVKENWDEAYLTDLANHSLPHVVEKIRTAERVGLFTTDQITPGDVASALLERGIDYFTAYVCENLGSPDERVTQGELRDLVGQPFNALNVLILVRKPNAPDRPVESLGRRLFGNPDELFLQSRPKQGLLTPAEVRAIALAELDIGPKSIVWDVGAGSGSVSVEAAHIAVAGTVYAIEMDLADIELIRQNAVRFGVKNLVPVHGRAPDAWRGLPQPDCVFLGGTGREVCRLVELSFEELRTGGRIVVSVGSIENLAAVHEALQNLAGDCKVWMINIARGTFQMERVRFAPLHPSFLLAAVKPA